MNYAKICWAYTIFGNPYRKNWCFEIFWEVESSLTQQMGDPFLQPFFILRLTYCLPSLRLKLSIENENAYKTIKIDKIVKNLTQEKQFITD